MAASDYKSSQTSFQNVNPTESTTIQTPNQPRAQTYLNAAKSTPKVTFPKKEQGIIMNAVESLKFADYVLALGSIIKPTDIKFASRISNNRICMYLASKELVDTLIESHQSINVCGIEVGIRRLITPAKRLILSNVCPTIPHDIIENSLKSLGLKLVSPISFLRAGMLGEEYAHLFSFRRQVYISSPADNILETLTSIVVSYEETAYRIFLTSDDMTCFLCKQRGHVANNCPNSNTTTTELSSSQLDGGVELSPTTAQKKRPAPSTSSLEKTPSLSDIEIMPPPKAPLTLVAQESRKEGPRKKAKRGNSPGPPISDASHIVIKDLYAKGEIHFPISLNSFTAFLENSFGNPDPINEARRFTNDVTQLIETMHKIHPHLPERGLKSRITRIHKKLKDQLKSEALETSSIASISSQESQEDLDIDIDNPLDDQQTEATSDIPDYQCTDSQESY